MKILCPFCKEPMEELEPEVIKTVMGSKTIYKKICNNKEKHFGNGNIIVPYKPDEEEKK